MAADDAMRRRRVGLLHARLSADAARPSDGGVFERWIDGRGGEGETKEAVAAYEQLAAAVHAALVRGELEEENGKLYVLAEGWQGAQGAARAARAAAEASVAAGRDRADVTVLTEHAGWGVDDLLDESGPLRDVEVIFVAAGGLIGLTGAEAVYEGLWGSGVLRNIKDIVRVRVEAAAETWTASTPGETSLSSALPSRTMLTMAGAIVAALWGIMCTASDLWSGVVDWLNGRFTVAPRMGMRSVGSGPPYDNVVVAGTFDRLHAGHRLLIFAALMVLRRGGNLWLGVTGDKLTASKKHRDVLEPYAHREAAAARYARAVVKGSARIGGHGDEGVTIRTGEITNPRKGIDGQPEVDALVVSEEMSTVSNAILIRRMKQLVRLAAYMNPFATEGRKEMSIVIVGLVSDGKHKVSSTQLRELDTAAAVTQETAT